MVVQRLTPSASPTITGCGVPTGPPSQPTFSPSAPIPSPPPSSTAVPPTHPATTTSTARQFEPINLSQLIVDNCQLVHPLTFKLVSSIRDDRWTVHATGGRRVFLSASGGSLEDAFEALHRKSAEEVDAYVNRKSACTPVTIGDYEEPSESEESDSEEEDDHDVPWGSFSDPYGCCGWDGSRPRTRLLPVTRRRSRMPFNRERLSSPPPRPPPPPPPPPSASPCPRPPPPPPPSVNPSPTGPRLTTSRTVLTPPTAPVLLVISWGADQPRRVVTRVAPSLRAVEREALRLVREAAPDRQPPADAKVRGVGVGESERFEVDGFGDDLSEVFGEGIPRVYVDVRVPGKGGGPDGAGESLLLTRPLGRDEQREVGS